ncbi:unnamed protein product [Amoebophrya sp. A120]|nr:unnamed protein product [Amoebophrya sp. A120]|eukprot:GSA120T00009777001.1
MTCPVRPVTVFCFAIPMPAADSTRTSGRVKLETVECGQPGCRCPHTRGRTSCVRCVSTLPNSTGEDTSWPPATSTLSRRACRIRSSTSWFLFDANRSAMPPSVMLFELHSARSFATAAFGLNHKEGCCKWSRLQVPLADLVANAYTSIFLA